MGGEKTTTIQSGSSQSQAKPTRQEKELMKLRLKRERAAQSGMIETQRRGLDLISQLLAGNEDLPGFFKELGGGISEEMSGQLADRGVESIQPMMQRSGLVDSGVNASISGRTAADIFRGSQEFNIGNRLNLLNLALSGQAQVQQPMLAQSQMLGQQLAGLRTQTGSYSGQSQTIGMNPFLKSFQQAAGQTLGSPSFGFGQGQGSGIGFGG